MAPRHFFIFSFYHYFISLCLGSLGSFGSSSGLSSSLLLGFLLGLELVDDQLDRSSAVDGSGWALAYAHATSLALLRIDVSHIALDSDGIELTGLLALAAADTSACTCLTGNSTLVLVDTANPDTLDGRSLGSILLADLEYELRTSLGTSATSYTLVLVDLWQTSHGVHVDGIEGTSLDAIAQTQAAECATSLACEGSSSYCARLGAIVVGNLRTALQVAIATYYSELWLGSSCLDTQYTGDAGHAICATYRAEQATQRVAGILLLDASISHTMTTREAATTAVSAWQQLLYLTHSRIFENIELLGHEIKDQRAYDSYRTKYDKRNYN